MVSIPPCGWFDSKNAVTTERDGVSNGVLVARLYYGRRGRGLLWGTPQHLAMPVMTMLDSHLAGIIRRFRERYSLV
jgi:hypothetical protein